jgi:methylmalonyl-CoA/ethylmalonyl-CoA epimerase|tara:strand:- start:1803 stop:2228 length:426 start_codon:yes stop_codon:yes gene_type:complete
MNRNNVSVDHIGIATNSLDDSEVFWKMLGFVQDIGDEIVEEQGVKVRYLSSPENTSDDATRIELLEPTGKETPIGRFLEKRGPGVQQICIRVDDINSTLNYLIEAGIELIDKTPKKGANGALIAFVHPKSTGGVLVELSQH